MADLRDAVAEAAALPLQRARGPVQAPRTSHRLRLVRQMDPRLCWMQTGLRPCWLQTDQLLAPAPTQTWAQLLVLAQGRGQQVRKRARVLARVLAPVVEQLPHAR